MYKDNCHKSLFNLTHEDHLLSKINILEYQEALRAEALTQRLIKLWYGSNVESREAILRYAEQLLAKK